MDQRRKRLLILTLAVLLSLSLGFSALAADVETVTAALGSYVRVLIPMPDGATLRDHSVLSGETAPGLVLRAEGTGLGLVGTPTQEGSWSVEVRCHTDSGDRVLIVEQYIVAPPATPAPTAVPTETPAVSEITATPAPTPEPTEASTPVPTPEPTLAPTPEGRPPITKEPTGETVSEGGTAIFVARAEDAVGIEWFLSDPEGGEPMEAQKAGERFSGLRIYGQGTETLTLTGIPTGMNGWQTECRFTGATGALSVTGRATITVRQGALAAPVIFAHPEGGEVYAGESITLSVNAVPPDGAEVLYQWYSSQHYDLATVHPLDGATGATFTPGNVYGPVYYCVGVRSRRGQEISSPAYSDLCVVTGMEGVREHTHAYYEQWHYDASGHWRECSCGERTPAEEHSLTWTTVQRPTMKEDGLRRGVCSVCGYEERESIPAGNNTTRVILIVLVVLVALALVLGALWILLPGRRRGGSHAPRSRSYHDTRSRRR